MNSNQTTALRFRDAVIEDLDIIIGIYNSTIPSGMVTADTQPVTTASRIEWFTAHSSQKRPLWLVLDMQDAIIGWVSFQSFYGRPAYDATAEISIYIHEQFRGRGFGKQILHYAIQNAPNYGIKTLLGFIFLHNDPSMRLFASCGFDLWGTLPRVAEIGGVDITLCILGIRLTA